MPSSPLYWKPESSSHPSGPAGPGQNQRRPITHRAELPLRCPGGGPESGSAARSLQSPIPRWSFCLRASGRSFPFGAPPCGLYGCRLTLLPRESPEGAVSPIGIVWAVHFFACVRVKHCRMAVRAVNDPNLAIGPRASRWCRVTPRIVLHCPAFVREVPHPVGEVCLVMFGVGDKITASSNRAGNYLLPDTATCSAHTTCRRPLAQPGDHLFAGADLQARTAAIASVRARTCSSPNAIAQSIRGPASLCPLGSAASHRSICLAPRGVDSRAARQPALRP